MRCIAYPSQVSIERAPAQSHPVRETIGPERFDSVAPQWLNAGISSVRASFQRLLELLLDDQKQSDSRLRGMMTNGNSQTCSLYNESC
jgi:hypothetical protein